MKKVIGILLFFGVVQIEASEKFKKLFLRKRESEVNIIKNPLYGMDTSSNNVRSACKQEELKSQKSAPELYNLKLRKRRMELAQIIRAKAEAEQPAPDCDDLFITEDE